MVQSQGYMADVTSLSYEPFSVMISTLSNTISIDYNIIILLYFQAVVIIIMREVIWNDFKSIQENFMLLLIDILKMEVRYKK